MKTCGYCGAMNLTPEKQTSDQLLELTCCECSKPLFAKPKKHNVITKGYSLTERRRLHDEGPLDFELRDY